MTSVHHQQAKKITKEKTSQGEEIVNHVDIILMCPLHAWNTHVHGTVGQQHIRWATRGWNKETIRQALQVPQWHRFITNRLKRSLKKKTLVAMQTQVQVVHSFQQKLLANMCPSFCIWACSEDQKESLLIPKSWTVLNWKTNEIRMLRGGSTMNFFKQLPQHSCHSISPCW